MDYKTSGVDIEKGREFVEELKTKIPTIGGFNGMFEIPSGYEKPFLVSGADGVGTKINILGLDCLEYLSSSNKGIIYPKVFPVPVCAIPNMSLPERITEKDCSCIGVGVLNPKSSMAL